MIRKNVTEEDKMEMAKRIKLAVNYLIVNEKAKNQKLSISYFFNG